MRRSVVVKSIKPSRTAIHVEPRRSCRRNIWITFIDKWLDDVDQENQVIICSGLFLEALVDERSAHGIGLYVSKRCLGKILCMPTMMNCRTPPLRSSRFATRSVEQHLAVMHV
ncbi:MAG: hypothetical protein EB048_06865 [Gammaproteobacteria bacterium]|nr:hypothetical protein [Gammaproteobacteria bacterium]